MMRLAICFFGQPRFLGNQVVHSYYSNLIKKYDADVYVHSWITGSDLETPLSRSSWVPKVYESPNAANTIIDWLNPKKFKFDLPFIGKLSDDNITLAKEMESYSEANELAILSHLKSVKESIDLIETPDDYDFILMTRFDVMLEAFPNLYELDSSKFYIRWQPNLWWYDAAQLCGSKFHKAFHTWNNIDSIIKYLHETDRRFYPELFKRRQYNLAGYDDNNVVYTKDLNYAIVRSTDGLTDVLR